MPPRNRALWRSSTSRLPWVRATCRQHKIKFTERTTLHRLKELLDAKRVPVQFKLQAAAPVPAPAPAPAGGNLPEPDDQGSSPAADQEMKDMLAEEEESQHRRAIQESKAMAEAEIAAAASSASSSSTTIQQLVAASVAQAIAAQTCTSSGAVQRLVTVLASLSPATKTAIKTDPFVYMNLGKFAMTAAHMFAGRELSDFAIDLGSGFRITHPDKRSQTAPTSFGIWLMYYLNYALVVAAEHPPRAVDLFGYIAVVREAFETAPTQAGNFDVMNRKSAGELHRPFTSYPPSLWLTALHRSTPPTGGRRPPHSRSPGAPAAASSSSGPPGRCRNWNGKKQCARSPCPYPHQCLRCGGPHRVSDCPNVSFEVSV
jgi:hypothetical protein